METQVQFQGDLLCIEDVRCCGRLPHREEAALRHEIVFVRRGVFQRRDAAGNTLADANHALLFTRARPFHVTHPAAGGDRCTVFTLTDAALMDVLHGRGDDADRPFAAGTVPLLPRHRLWHHHLLCLAADPTCTPLAVEESALRVLSEVLSGAFFPPAAPARPHDDVVMGARLVLSERLGDTLSLSELARQVGASPFWLCRIFKAATGVTLHQYRLRLRLAHALERLAECPDESLTALALDLGFYSHSHFTTTFTRHFHISPAQFRRTATTARLRALSKILQV